MYTFEQICEGCIYALFAPIPGNKELQEQFACRSNHEAACDTERGLCAHKTLEGGGGAP